MVEAGSFPGSSVHLDSILGTFHKKACSFTFCKSLVRAPMVPCENCSFGKGKER